MSKKQLALAISGALVVAGAAYLWFRARPKRQVLKPLAPVRESVEQLKLKADAGATGDKCKLALLLLNAGSEQEVSRALELLHNAAESGAVEAMIHLGSHYISTDKPDRPADPEKAMKWWSLAVEAGSGAAAKKLGDLYLNRKILRLADADSGFLPNQLVTLHGLSNAALNGALGVVVDPAAQSPDVPQRLMIRLILAQQETMQKHEKYFKEGIKVKVVNMTRLTNVKDFGKAISYYKKAIELACDDDSGPESMVELAKLFEEGQGLEKNEEEAFKLLNMAADAGFQPAFPRLAMCYFSGAGVQQDYARCLDLVTASSSLGESKFVLSCMYFEGRAVEKDEKKAVELLRESAQTCSMAMLSLGSLHLSGEHVELDEAQAFSYFKQASDLDLAPAQAHCGHMLFQGIGCEKSEENMSLGVKMLSMAAEENEPIALMALWQLCLMQGDSAQALEFLRRAVSAKHPEALFVYGQMLKHGQGVAMDDAEGERLTAEAIALGFDVEAAKAASGQ